MDPYTVTDKNLITIKGEVFFKALNQKIVNPKKKANIWTI